MTTKWIINNEGQPQKIKVLQKQQYPSGRVRYHYDEMRIMTHFDVDGEYEGETIDKCRSTINAKHTFDTRVEAVKAILLKMEQRHRQLWEELTTLRSEMIQLQLSISDA